MKLAIFCETKVKQRMPIAIQTKGDKRLRIIPIFDVLFSSTFDICLKAISLNGTRIHHACANCQITKMNMYPHVRNLSIFCPYVSLFKAAQKKLENTNERDIGRIKLVKDLLRDKFLTSSNLLSAAVKK